MFYWAVSRLLNMILLYYIIIIIIIIIIKSISKAPIEQLVTKRRVYII